MKDSTINISKLQARVRKLHENPNASNCVESISQMSDRVSLGSAVQRTELLRTYQRRELRSLKKDTVVPGGASLVRELEDATVESVFVIPISTPNWSGIVFLENSKSMRCLGCLSGSRDNE